MIASILTVFGKFLIVLIYLINILIADPLSSLYSRLVSNNKKRAFKFYHNKVVFVTGASSGIGECICKQLSSYGANLILVSRDIAKLHQVMKECEQVRILSTQSFAICPIDIERYNDINVDSINKKLVEYNCCFTCYDIDIVVLNAGVSSRGSVVDTDMKTFEKLMNVNFFGNTALIKAILPSMLTRGKGDISVVSSVQGKIGIPLRSSYAASKFALQGFFDSLRSEIAHKNINILIVSPGMYRNIYLYTHTYTYKDRSTNTQYECSFLV